MAANGIFSSFFFFFVTEQYSTVSMYHIFFIHSSVEGHLGFVHVLAVLNNAAVNIGVHGSFWIKSFLWIYTWSGIVGLYASPILFAGE